MWFVHVHYPKIRKSNFSYLIVTNDELKQVKKKIKLVKYLNSDEPYSNFS